ncbi:MbtH family protein [Streptomyces sp. NPDC048664]|uniref:MbtH family protein n=1 Tax=Streptomyces sp. NPDC048664 TaxID=3154505 RepID=UPI003427A5D6
MPNPFDDPNGTYLVLADGKGHRSLWPAFADVPAGWAVVRHAGTRKECLDHIDHHPTDRPIGAETT